MGTATEYQTRIKREGSNSWEYAWTSREIDKARKSVNTILNLATVDEVKGIREALRAGEFNGACYFDPDPSAKSAGNKGTGCLIGTIVKQRMQDKSPEEIDDVMNNFGCGFSIYGDNREEVKQLAKQFAPAVRYWRVHDELTPAEKFVGDIDPGCNPNNNEYAAYLDRWIGKWLDKNGGEE